MTVLMPFSNDEFELQITPVGDSFIVAAPGFARALGFREAYDLIRSVPDDEKGSEIVRTPGGDQRVWHVTEAGFYRAIGQRQAARVRDLDVRAQVERFQSWVYGEVLPAIRRTGRYEPQAPAELDELEVARRYVAALEAKKALEVRVAELEPSAAAWDHLGSGDGDWPVADAAKILSRDPAITIGSGRLFARLDEWGWTFRAGDQRWRAKQAQVDLGRLSEIPQSHYHPRTGELVLDPPQVRIKPKGLAEIHRRLGGTSPIAAGSALELTA